MKFGFAISESTCFKKELVNFQNNLITEIKMTIDSSMTSSGIVRTFTSAKHELDIKSSMRRIYAMKKNLRKRHRYMEEYMKKLGKPVPTETGFNTEKFVDSMKDYTYHSMPLDELVVKLDSNLVTGLSDEEVERRLAQGQNTVKQPKQTHWVIIFLSQMSDPFSLLIWGLVVLSFIGYFLLRDSNQLLLTIILLVTIISGAIISFGFARKTENDIKDLQDYFPRFSTVIREGVLKTVKSKKLVKGDIVVFKSGDTVPADVRVIESTGMMLNKATFTGESEPVEATSDCTNVNNPLQSNNMIFCGTVTLEGVGKGIVLNTGEAMLISKIRDILINGEPKESYLQKQIAKFVKVITVFALFIGTFTFVGGIIIGFPIVIAADIAIGVTVASVPGILNLELICILYFSVRALLKKNMICKSLVAIQTLGSTQILCTDKTGTLTTNRMTILDFFYNNSIIQAKNKQYYSDVEYNTNDPTFKCLQKCAVLSSVAMFDRSPPKDSITKISSRKDILESQKEIREKQIEKDWELKYNQMKYSQRQTIGDSTESALIRFFQPIQDINCIRQKYPITRCEKENRENRTLFSSTEKFSFSINYDPTSDSDNCIYVKGAPEKIWEMCHYVMINGNSYDKNSDIGRKYEEIPSLWGKEGKRILAFCMLRLPKNKFPKNFDFRIENRNFPLKGMTYIGIASIQDPPRIGISETMLRLKQAGIKIIIVTGDQQTTAVSIGRQCNIISNKETNTEFMRESGCSFKEAFNRCDNVVITGEQLVNIIIEDELKQKHQKGRRFERIMEKEGIIFARTSPAQKLYITEQIQNLDYVVSVTGDGVNDSPAIKMANTGLAMGSGSDAARDAADIIISDDNLNSICFGIEEGRRLFDNFKKAICYVMTSQVSEWVPFVFLILSQIPIPIFTLLVDGAADFVPTLAFAFEESEEGIMTRPPKLQEEPLISLRLLVQCQGWMGFSSFLCCLLGYYIVMIDYGFVPGSLWGHSNSHILLEGYNDHYNPTDPYFGNSTLQNLKSCEQFQSNRVRVDWINSTFPRTDLRMSSVSCSTNSDGTLSFKQTMVFSECRIQQISIYTLKPICYTPEATKYGQTSYMYCNVVNQIFNWVICRTRKDSAILKRFNNKICVFGIAVEVMMALALSYTSFMIKLIGTRDVIFQHYGIAAIPFAVVQLTMDETRKYLIRNLPNDKYGRPNWFVRNSLW